MTSFQCLFVDFCRGLPNVFFFFFFFFLVDHHDIIDFDAMHLCLMMTYYPLPQWLKNDRSCVN